MQKKCEVWLEKFDYKYKKEELIQVIGCILKIMNHQFSFFVSILCNIFILQLTPYLYKTVDVKQI